MPGDWCSSMRWAPTPLSSPLRLRTHRGASLLRGPEEPRQEHHDAPYEPSHGRDGTFSGGGRSDHLPSVRDLRQAPAGSCPPSWSGCGDGRPWGSQAKEGKGAHRGEGKGAHLPAILLPRPQPHRGSPLEGQAHPKEGLSPHQGDPDRGDGSSIGSGERSGCTRILRPLWLPHPGAATMKGAVTSHPPPREPPMPPTRVAILQALPGAS